MTPELTSLDFTINHVQTMMGRCDTVRLVSDPSKIQFVLERPQIWVGRWHFTLYAESVGGPKAAEIERDPQKSNCVITLEDGRQFTMKKKGLMGRYYKIKGEELGSKLKWHTSGDGWKLYDKTKRVDGATLITQSTPWTDIES